MKRINQSGFAAIEAVLIVVIVAMVAGTGYFVWHAKQNADKSLNAANESASKIASAPKSTQGKDGTGLGESKQYLPIKEWGVKIPLTTNLAAATYSMIDTSNGNVISLVDNQCYLGAIERSKDGTISAADGSRVADSYAKKVGTYYYSYVHPQAGCSDVNGNATDTSLQLLAKQAVDGIVAE